MSNVINLPQIPSNVKSVRVMAGLTQQQAAKVSNVDAASIIKAEFDIEPMTSEDWNKYLCACQSITIKGDNNV